jgi:hypothetical protein
MILYTEQQLEDSYKIYCSHQSQQDIPFMKLADFRRMFETIMENLYEHTRLKEN